MKNYILFVLMTLPLVLKSQSIDSSRTATRLDSLIKLALQLSQEKKFEAAENVISDAKNIAIQTFGTGHFWHAQALLSQGNVKNRSTKYVEAVQFYQQALAIKDPQWLNHVNYGLCIKGSAVCHTQLRDYKTAEHYNFELIHFYGRTNHSEKLDYASAFYDLANLYRYLDDYEQSVIYCNKALAIWKEVYGKESVNYANSQFKIADVYCNLFLYVEAERMYAESRDILKRILGPEHPDYAMGLQRIGIHYQVSNQPEVAESFLLEAMQIRAKTIGKENGEYGSSLQAMAQISSILGKNVEAEQYFLECSQVRVKIHGKFSPVYAITLIHFANHYNKISEYSKAYALLLEAKAIVKNHPYYWFCLRSLGDLLIKKGDYLEALEVYEELSEYMEKVNFIDYFTQSRLGYGHYLVGNQEKAIGILQKADSSLQAELVRATQYLPESDLGLYAKRFYRQLDDQLSFTYHHPNPNLVELCFDQSLFLKGILLNTSSTFQRFINIAPHTRDKFDQLRTQQSLLALEYTKSTTSHTAILEMEAKVHELQRDLSKNISGFSQVAKKVSWKDIQAKLKAGQAAIEFVHFNLLFPKNSNSVMYAALVVLPNGRPPLFVPLCEEKSLDSLIATQGERKADYVNGIYANDDRGITFAGKPSKTAYELLWKPLEKLLDGVTRVYYTPSGLLHRLNLGALSMPIAKQSDLVKVISDRVQMVQLNSTRQLALPHQTGTANLSAVLYGGIRYDLDSTLMMPTALLNENVHSINHRGLPLFSDMDTTLRGGTWGYLKWTEKEINSIAPVLKNHGFQPILHQGFLGTEESFKTIGRMGTSPRVLHIATHGFFFPDPTTAKQSMSESNIAFRISEHPMIRSGLVLAGGNHAWQNKPVRTGKEDGILTAYEISQMNLSNTELVVLSACETGLGDIQGNEGVYGLQRAFKIAGVRYLIMSLWQVPDFQTQELMVTFYQHWLERKMSIPDAFRAAQEEMREKYQHPYFWAGFVLVE